ncbi:MAG: cupin domain-containing protein [Gemmatimonadota bacterium]|nr:cupin domain-containing protein [Gemmatimonadota bacterium]
MSCSHLVHIDDLAWESHNLSGQSTTPGYRKKTLVVDETTTRRVALIEVAPGYGDSSAYHDSAEEGFFISGDCYLSGEGAFEAGFYFWRPAGFVHAASSERGFVALVITEGESSAEGSGPTSRVPRPDSEAGTNALASGESAVGPRGWVQRLDTALLPWWPGPNFFRGRGGNADLDAERLAVKVLSENARTGAQSLLVRVSPSFRSEPTGPIDARVEMYVLTGSISVGERHLRAGHFAQQQVGSTTGAIASEEGALAILKTSARLDLAARP